MLYQRILELQWTYPFFNRQILSVDTLVAWAEKLGARVIADRGIKYPVTYWDRQPVIEYNSTKSDALQILMIGHEIGQILLGHAEVAPRSSHLFTENGWESDVSIIGYLCLVLTPDLIKMARNGVQTPEELFSELQPMFGDDEKHGMKICERRISIFDGLLKVCGGRCLRDEGYNPCGWCQVETNSFYKPPIPAHDIVTVDAPFEVPPGAEYRFRNDPPHIIRFRFGPPLIGQSVRMIVRDIPVAGISLGECRANAGPFASGNSRSLELVRDPGNKHDPNAIKVIGHWQGVTGTQYSEQIGWVPKRIAAGIAREYGTAHLYATLRILFIPAEGKIQGIRFDVWMRQGNT